MFQGIVLGYAKMLLRKDVEYDNEEEDEEFSEKGHRINALRGN